MAKDPNNLTSTKREIKQVAEAVQRMKDERQEINESIAERRAKLVTLGIPKAAFDMAMKYLNWDEDKRRGFDTAYSIAREAIGLPFNDQGDLFVPEDEEKTQSQNAAAQSAAFQ
jgi:uncharacterized protein (UPF0335 family)